MSGLKKSLKYVTESEPKPFYQFHCLHLLILQVIAKTISKYSNDLNQQVHLKAIQSTSDSRK